MKQTMNTAQSNASETTFTREEEKYIYIDHDSEKTNIITIMEYNVEI